MEHAPGSWSLCSHVIPPPSISFHLPKLGSQQPAPPPTGTLHTNQSPYLLSHDGCHPPLLAGAWPQPEGAVWREMNDGHCPALGWQQHHACIWAGASLSLTCIQILSTFRPWGLKILGGHPSAADWGSALSWGILSGFGGWNEQR